MKVTRRTVLKGLGAVASAHVVPSAGIAQSLLAEGISITPPPHWEFLIGADGAIGAAQFLEDALQAKDPAYIAIGIGHRLSWMHIMPKAERTRLSQLVHDPSYIQQIIDYISRPENTYIDKEGKRYPLYYVGRVSDDDLKADPKKIHSHIEWILNQPEFAGMEQSDWQDHLIHSFRKIFSDNLDAFKNLDWHDILDNQFYHQIPDFCRYFGDLIGPEILEGWEKTYKHLAFRGHCKDIEYKSEQLLQETKGEDRNPLTFSIRPIEVPAKYEGEIRGYKVSVPLEDPKRQKAALQIIRETVLKDIVLWETPKAEAAFIHREQNGYVLIIYTDRDNAKPLDELCILSRAEEMAKEQPTRPPDEPIPETKNEQRAPQ